MSDDARTQEAEIHPKMMDMWIRRLKSIKQKSGLGAANTFFSEFFSTELQQKINQEIRNRRKK